MVSAREELFFYCRGTLAGGLSEVKLGFGGVVSGLTRTRLVC